MTCLSLLTPCIFPFLCDLCVMCVCVVRVFGGSKGDGGWLFLVGSAQDFPGNLRVLGDGFVSSRVEWFKQRTHGIKCRTNADDATALSLAGILSQHKVEGGCESCFKTVPYLAVFPNSSSS